ncbi:hypothetical protein [Microbacterium sp. BK668]|uniref:hypothetical protein n=1 Tax=Microbacterium sp. BK668 TaxID=2512118 RepID=UPI0010608D61|nr:hypothetical protein [Microbacterium sp. BK668]TDN91803.1 hypothetical protein EV279_1308 [Microbacterium sp. BK668]
MTQSGDAGNGRGWPKGRLGWIAGSIIMLIVGAIVGLVLGSIWLGLVIAAVVALGWMIAYESQRGRTPDLYDQDDDGARL